MESHARAKLGKRIASYRQKLGLTQEQLAERLRVTPETVSRFERGAIAPSFDRLEMLAAVFHVQLRDLFEFDSRLPKVPVRSERDAALSELSRAVRHCSAAELHRLKSVVLEVLRYAKGK